MPIHIESLTNEVTLMDADMPMSEQQLDKVARFVMMRMQQKMRDSARQAAATCVDRGTTNLDKEN